MLTLIGRRILIAIPTLFLVSLFVFALQRALPGDPFLVMAGEPLNEPIAAYGPFVMNTREEIVQTFNDYQKTQFGGWKWGRQDMIHGPGADRFAKYPDGRVEKPV